ncbi:hypothetical protein [Komagataeibacter europaeus]|nr:hypothetical protein [Komagataeibacter europaeus]
MASTKHNVRPARYNGRYDLHVMPAPVMEAAARRWLVWHYE